MESESIEKQGFMPDHDGYPVSRDWQELECGAKSCVNNHLGICLVPSLAVIGEDGRCKGFQAQKTEYDRKDP